MGNYFLKGFQRLFGGPEVRILMVGLDNAGKTTILYKFRLNETVSTVPTIGFNVETVKYKNIAFTVWDIGGQNANRHFQKISVALGENGLSHTTGLPKGFTPALADKIRNLWRVYLKGSTGLIFVVDSSDKHRMNEAKNELHRLLQEEDLKNAYVLVFANKQDVIGASNVNDVKTLLGLADIATHKWFIQPTVATKGEGLFEGFDWLAAQINDSFFNRKMF